LFEFFDKMTHLSFWIQFRFRSSGYCLLNPIGQIACVQFERPIRAKVKTFSKTLAVAFSSMMALSGLYALYLVLTHNVHVVSAGRIYRSNQMDEVALARLIHQCGIKTIVNLRGANLRDAWYTGETNVANQLGVKHLDFVLSAATEPADDQIDQILAALNRAPKPVLIHCRSGADRTGLISALYLYSLEGQSAKVAGRQLSIFYGHVPAFLGTASSAMDRSYAHYIESHLIPTNTGSLVDKLGIAQ
jgi:protein tyrosine phosphatase (PTP) superfamily phosphohydrolase (DUF442 family)